MSFKISTLTGKLYNNELIEIPFDTNNELYLEFESWLQSGNSVIYFEGTPEEITEGNKPIVPSEISAMDLKLQLFDLGITDQDIFEDIDSIPDSMFPASKKQKAKIKYQTAAKFKRFNADLNLVATMEGLTQEQLDEIFINGKLLN